MFSRPRFALTLALVLSVIFVIPVFAGGWAVITLDELPSDVVAGKPLTIGFTVLQHGKTPMDDLHPTVTAILPKESEFVVDAEPDGKPGHYTATLTFPKEGEWNWSIQAFSMDQPMPVLSVAPPIVGAAIEPIAKVEPVPASISPLLIVRVAALGLGLAGLVMIAFRRKSRLAVALTVLCLLVGVGTFVTTSTVPAVEAQSKPLSKDATVSSISQVELGRQLFIIKGCITCHVNNKVASASRYQVIDIGTNLTKFSASPEALRLRLKDPSSVKSDTQMPNLRLSDAEIEALIAFINSK